MCVVSMVMDHYWDKWGTYPRPSPFQQPKYPPFEDPFSPFVQPPVTPQITPDQIEEFKKLLERAREYDKRNKEPECELQEKKQRLLDLAKELGVDISFL